MKTSFSHLLVGRSVAGLTGKKAVAANQKLRSWNTWLAVLYALEGLAILFLSSANASVPIVSSFLSKDSLASGVAGTTVLAPAAHLLFNLHVAYAVAAFLFTAAVIRALAASRMRTHYERDLKSGTHCFRWAESALAGGLMLVALGLASGITELTALVTLFAVSAAAFVVVGAIEQSVAQNKAKVSRLYAVLAAVLMLVSFLVVLWHLLAAILYGGAAISPYVYAAFVVTLVIFALLAVTRFKQQSKFGKKADHYQSEKLYMGLGFVAKTLLAWLLFVGVLAG